MYFSQQLMLYVILAAEKARIESLKKIKEAQKIYLQTHQKESQ